MIPKGNQRGGGQQLATHLLNEFDNERVEVAQIRGAMAPDLHGAFAEWHALSRATQCRKYLYSLSLNPDPGQGPLTRAQYLDFINRTERALGLSEQARAVIFHVKHEREHCHVVWSRIDERTMKAVQISHDHQALRTVARAFARDHKLRLPPSMQKDRGTERYKDRQKRENLFEQQQQERSGISKQERMAAITQAWKESADGKTLVAALERKGYLLARGDKRTHVVVDRAGEIHALARQIIGIKTRQVKARLAGYPVEKLPDGRKAQEFLRAKQRQKEEREAKLPATGREPEAGSAAERRAALARRQAQRRAALTAQKEAMEKAHGAERELLRSAQKLETLGVKQARENARTGPVLTFLMRITGFGRIAAGRRQRADAQRGVEHRLQRHKLVRRHDREVVDFRHREHALASVDARERRSLETQLRREGFERASGRERPSGREARPPPGRALPHAPRGTDRRTARPTPLPGQAPRTQPRDTHAPVFNTAARSSSPATRSASPPLTESFTGAAPRGHEPTTPKDNALRAAFARSVQDRVCTPLTAASRAATHWLRGALARLFTQTGGNAEALRPDPPVPARGGRLRALFARAVAGVGASGAPAPQDAAAPRGTISQPFNDPVKMPERPRGDHAAAGPATLSQTFTAVVARARNDRIGQLRQEMRDEFRRRAGQARRPHARDQRSLAPGRDHEDRHI